MSKILVVAGHPEINTNSVGNKLIVEQLGEKLENVTIHKLGELYPDYKIDVEKEQKILMEHNVIVFQFPYFWYTVPALMKKWLDDVFVHGFSHGRTGDKLHGKKILFSITTGAPAEAYTHEGAMKHTVEDYLYLLDTFAEMTGMEKIGVVKTNGISYSTRANGLEPSDEVREKIDIHVNKVIEILKNNM